MIKTLYEIFQHWSAKGSVYLLSDLHLNDDDCLLMDPDWIPPEEQIGIINNKVTRGDTFICLGDVGSPEFAAQIKAGHKVLLLGNHDHRKDYKDIFDDGLSWCLNIHGHDHNGIEPYAEGCKHLNLAANVCGYTPVSLGDLIKGGILADINGIHRQTIDRAAERKQMKRHLNEGINMFSEDYINSIEERSGEK